MDKYLYEGFYSYNPVEHQHDDDYIPVDPGDHMEVETPLEFPVEGTMEQPKVMLEYISNHVLRRKRKNLKVF